MELFQIEHGDVSGNAERVEAQGEEALSAFFPPRYRTDKSEDVQTLINRSAKSSYFLQMSDK